MKPQINRVSNSKEKKPFWYKNSVSLNWDDKYLIFANYNLDHSSALPLKMHCRSAKNHGRPETHYTINNQIMGFWLISDRRAPKIRWIKLVIINNFYFERRLISEALELQRSQLCSSLCGWPQSWVQSFFFYWGKATLLSVISNQEWWNSKVRCRAKE